MTWLGKILTVLVLLGSVVAVAFTTQAYVTRTNWKKRAETYKLAYEKANQRADAERKGRIADAANADVLIKVASQEAEVQGQQIAALTVDSTGTMQRITGLAGRVTNRHTDVMGYEAAAKALIDREQAIRAEKVTLSSANADLQFALDKAGLDMRNAEARAATYLFQVEFRDRQLKRTQEELEQARRQLQDRSLAGGRTESFNPDRRPAKPLEPGTRGTVVAYEGGLMVVGLGLDQGVAPGTVLNVRRPGGDQRYLGRAVVGETVRQKQAVAAFEPQSGRPLRSLTPDEVPAAGDVVEPALSR